MSLPLSAKTQGRRLKTFTLIRVALALAALAVVAWATLSPHPPSILPQRYDKIGHYAVFAICSFMGGFAILYNRRWLPFVYWGVCFGLAVFLEYAQGWWLPGRTFDLGDLRSNLLGVTTALGLWMVIFCAFYLIHRFKKKPEAPLSK